MPPVACITVSGATTAGADGARLEEVDDEKEQWSHHAEPVDLDALSILDQRSLGLPSFVLHDDTEVSVMENDKYFGSISGRLGLARGRVAAPIRKLCKTVRQTIHKTTQYARFESLELKPQRKHARVWNEMIGDKFNEENQTRWKERITKSVNEQIDF